MTTLIKNVQLVDGSGKPPFRADVLVRGGVIMALGSFPNQKADTIINGNEGYLVPGFIDTDVTSDRYLTLFSHPQHSNFLLQGVTSVMMGQCGFSLAPNMYGSLHHYVDWASINTINVNWKSVQELLNVWGGMKLGVNVGTMIGHRVVREDIVKNPAEQFRNLTANELRVFRMVVERAMKEGAFGLSSGLGYGAYKNVSYHEIRALVDVIKKAGGVYSTHVRDEREGIVDSVEEVLKLAQELSVSVLVSHLRPFKGYEEHYRKALALIDDKTTKADVYFDINPFSESAVPVDSFLPPSMKEEARDSMIIKLNDDAVVKVVETHCKAIAEKTIVILHAPGMEFLNGKSLQEFANNRGMTKARALVELMRITKLRAVVLNENLNKKEVESSIMHERALISTNSPSVDGMIDKSFAPKRMYATFPAYLSLADKAGMRVERAIAKITGLPAKLLGLDGRGFISGGYGADLVLLTKDFSVRSVLVNGVVAVSEGELVNASSGVLLKKSR